MIFRTRRPEEGGRVAAADDNLETQRFLVEIDRAVELGNIEDGVVESECFCHNRSFLGLLP